MALNAQPLVRRLGVTPATPSPDGAESQKVDETGERRASAAPGIQQWGLVLILAVFLVLATYYNVSVPLFESPDELQHAAYVVWLADGHSLPVLDPDQPGPWEQEGTQAPMYYWLVATALGSVPHEPAEQVAVLNPQANIGEPLSPGNKNRVLHDTEREGWPFQETSLLVHLGRFFSTILAMGTLWAIYRLGRIVFPTRAGIALAMTALVAFTPQFLFLSSTVSNDNLVILLSSWALVSLAAWLRLPRLPGWGQVGSMGVLLGLALLAKLSGLLLWPLTAGVLLWLGWRSKDPRWLVKAGLLCFAIALAVGGWWLARSQILYGDLTSSGVLAAALGGQRHALPTRLSDILAEFRGFRYSLWALFGWFNILAPDAYYWFVDAMTILGLVGFCLFVIRSLPHYPRSTRQTIVMLFVWLGFMAAGVLRWAILISSQGRLAFPALAAAAMFLVLGWAELIPRRLRRAVGVAGLVLWATWAALCPSLVIRPAYAQPPALDPSEIGDQVSFKTNMIFQNEATLLGYQMDRETVEPGDQLWVRACWKGNQDIEDNYFVFVQVLADNDLIAGQEDTYHGLGSFPTSVWPAGVIFCDEYPLRISDTVPAPGPTVIALGLYRTTGERLPVSNASGQPASDMVRFPGPEIIFPEQGRTLAYDWGRQIALVDYDLETTAVAPGESFDITLTWSAARPISTDYAATLQVFSERGEKVGQSDAILPSSTWQVGTPESDHRSITISPEAGAGVYQLKLAVYDPETVSNLTLYRDQEMISGDGLLTLWTLRVHPK